MFIWKINAQSDKGSRPENQDNYLVIQEHGQYQHLKDDQTLTGQLDHWPEQHVRIAVADGMGGHENGRLFTEIAIEKLLYMPFQSSPEALKTALLELHHELQALFYQNSRSPGCTLVMADISPDRVATLANIGDSRAFLIAPSGEEAQLTQDYDLNEAAWRAKLIDAQEYQQQIGQRHGLAQAFGFGCIRLKADERFSDLQHKHYSALLDLQVGDGHVVEGVARDVFRLKLPPHAKLTLASDGLWNGNDNTTVVELG